MALTIIPLGFLNRLAVRHDGEKYVAITPDGIYTSHDGFEWEYITTFPRLATLGKNIDPGVTNRIDYPSALEWNGFQFLGIIHDENQTTFSTLTSPNGIDWTWNDAVATFSNSTPAVPGGLAWNGIHWCYSPHGYSKSLRSTDGVTWTEGTTIPAGSSPQQYSFTTKKLFWDGTYFVAAGMYRCFRSTDGLTWTIASTLSFVNSDTFCYDGSSFYIAAYEETLKSTDGGASWTSYDNPEVISDYISIAWTGTKFIGYKNGTDGSRVIESDDGVSFTAMEVPFEFERDFYYGKFYGICVGQNGQVIFHDRILGDVIAQENLSLREVPHVGANGGNLERARIGDFLPINRGGTGGLTPYMARDALGVLPGRDVQRQSDSLKRIIDLLESPYTSETLPFGGREVGDSSLSMTIGNNNVLDGAHCSVAIGSQAVARQNMQLAHAAGELKTSGSRAQYSRYVMTSYTSSASPSQFEMEAYSWEFLDIPLFSTWAFNGDVLAVSKTGEIAKWKFSGVATCGAAWTDLTQKSTVTREFASVGASNLGFRVEALENDSSDAYGFLELLALGSAGMEVNWIAVINTIEIFPDIIDMNSSAGWKVALKEAIFDDEPSKNSQEFLASEALAAGDLVNLWNDAGTMKVRLADGTDPNKEAVGFVIAAASSGGSSKVFFEGLNKKASGLALGKQFLSVTAPGKTQSTAPTVAGQIVQQVGFATSTTSMTQRFDRPITIGS